MKRRWACAAPLLLAGLPLFAAAESAADAPAAIMTLGEAEQQALAHSPLLQAATAEVGFADAFLQERRSRYLPQLYGDLTAAGAKMKGLGDADGSDAAGNPANAVVPRVTAGGINNPSVFDRAAAGVTLNQLITDFGHTDNLVASAKAQLRAAKSGFEDQRQRLLVLVDADYFRALQAQATVEVADATLTDRQTLLQEISALQQHQLRSGLDVQFATVDVQQARLLQLQSRSKAQAALAELVDAMGIEGPTDLQLGPDTEALDPPPAQDPRGLQAALAARPDLQRLRDNVEAAGKYARAQAELNRPVLSAEGAAGVTGAGDPHLPQNYVVGAVNLNIPIFTGGRLSAQASEASQRLAQAQDALSTAQLAAVKDIRVAWLNVRAGFDAIGVSGTLKTAAQSGLALARSRYRLGLGSIVELNRAQLNAVDAQIQYLSARYDYRIQQTQLAYQLGKISASPTGPAP